jgi:hypothetical protein
MIKQRKHEIRRNAFGVVESEALHVEESSQPIARSKKPVKAVVRGQAISHLNKHG